MSKTFKEAMAEFEDDIMASEEWSKPCMVESPPHYNQGGIQTIDYMKAYSTREEFCGHLRLTAIKYLSRSGKKNNTIEDLKKGRWYLDKLIEELQNDL